MSVLVKNSNRPTVTLRQVSRHTWGDDPDRVVVVAIVQEGERRFARCIGVVNGVACELGRMESPSVRRNGRQPVLTGEDGSVWELRSIGCSCSVPRQLKGLNVLGVPPS